VSFKASQGQQVSRLGRARAGHPIAKLLLSCNRVDSPMDPPATIDVPSEDLNVAKVSRFFVMRQRNRAALHGPIAGDDDLIGRDRQRSSRARESFAKSRNGRRPSFHRWCVVHINVRIRVQVGEGVGVAPVPCGYEGFQELPDGAGVFVTHGAAS